MKNYFNLWTRKLATKMESERIKRVSEQVSQEIYISSNRRGCGTDVYLYVKGVPVLKVVEGESKRTGEVSLCEARELMGTVRDNQTLNINGLL